MHLGSTQAGADPQIADSQALRVNKLDLVERLADDLAHEIKNPLHSMVINLEVLKRRVSRVVGEDQAEDLLRYVGVLGGELDRVSRRVELLLRMVRSDRGAEPVTLGEVLDDLLELVELDRERRGITVNYAPSDTPVLGHLPRDAARQMTLNLLLDALESLAPGGRLDIRTEVDSGWTRLRLEGAVPLPDGSGALPPITEGRSPRFGIARALAEACGGHLEATPGPSAGEDHVLAPLFAVVLSLPLATA